MVLNRFRELNIIYKQILCIMQMLLYILDLYYLSKFWEILALQRQLKDLEIKLYKLNKYRCNFKCLKEFRFFVFCFWFQSSSRDTVLFFFFQRNSFIFIIYLFIFGCVGSSFLCEGFLQLPRAGVTLHRGARASHCRGLSCCGAQAPDAQAQQLWLSGLVAPRHVGSSQTRARARVPCIGRQILNHCATREAWNLAFKWDPKMN